MPRTHAPAAAATVSAAPVSAAAVFAAAVFAAAVSAAAAPRHRFADADPLACGAYRLPGSLRTVARSRTSRRPSRSSSGGTAGSTRSLPRCSPKTAASCPTSRAREPHPSRGWFHTACVPRRAARQRGSRPSHKHAATHTPPPARIAGDQRRQVRPDAAAYRRPHNAGRSACGRVSVKSLAHDCGPKDIVERAPDAQRMRHGSWRVQVVHVAHLSS